MQIVSVPFSSRRCGKHASWKPLVDIQESPLSYAAAHATHFGLLGFFFCCFCCCCAPFSTSGLGFFTFSLFGFFLAGTSAAQRKKNPPNQCTRKGSTVKQHAGLAKVGQVRQACRFLTLAQSRRKRVYAVKAVARRSYLALLHSRWQAEEQNPPAQASVASIRVSPLASAWRGPEGWETMSEELLLAQVWAHGPYHNVYPSSPVVCRKGCCTGSIESGRLCSQQLRWRQ